MKPKPKERFKVVYYVAQTQPKLQICGFTFDKREAEQMSLEVKKVTGAKGKIIMFTRNQIKRLNYVH